MQKAKSFIISKHLVWQAWKRVRANGGSAGVDRQGIEDFEQNLKGNLYKIWNRMSSGSYLPLPVKLVEIPKDGSGTRPLGVPCVSDRVAQMVVVLLVEPLLEPVFHESSYGYRSGRSAHDALSQAREKCWRYDWVLDMDIKGFFDNINHALLQKALHRHVQLPWVRLYIDRWLTAPYQKDNGELVARVKGVPQGSVVGPVLANLFLHYAFDEWMRRCYPEVPFERYADDAICHCRTRQEAEELKEAIKERLGQCELELNEAKTGIVYCKDSNRKEDHSCTKFDFLGYTFRPRQSVNGRGQLFTSFLPAISAKARKRIRQRMRAWWKARRTDKSLEELARWMNPSLQGWINYYGRFYPSALKSALDGLNERLTIWVTKKYKRFRGRRARAREWLSRLSKSHGDLFAHWRLGILPRETPA